MKKIISMLVMIVILSACSNQSAPVHKNGNKSNEQEVISNQTEEATNNAKDEESSKNENDPEQSEEIDEEPEPEALYRMNQNTYSFEPISDANSKVALLTIDDAPDKYALEMAKTLKSLGAPAIFFVNGHFINTEEKKDILKQIYDLGFTIGNHTYSHKDLKSLTPDEQEEEMISVNDVVEEITGERPKFFRAPFGSNTDHSKNIALDEEMLLMNWTYGYDWESQYMSKESLADIMVNTEILRDGANLLMHDREWTKDALEEIVNGLREKGYEILDPKLIETPASE